MKTTNKDGLSAANTSWLPRGFRVGITLLMVAAAIWAGLRLWDYYELSPWTRDGRVRANVVLVAPDVSGLVTSVPIHDNEAVSAGTVLFEIDRARYELALRQAQAALEAQRIALAQARREDARNAVLANVVSQELREQTRAKVEQAGAALAQAEVARDTAKLNLQRARVQASVDGLVTNLDLRQGGYVTAGHPVLALVDAQSFYVEGYFEETKLPRIRIGDPVRVTAMGGRPVLTGVVQSVVAGVADRDRSTSANLLPSVNPTFNWVRLAQRIPVRVKLDPLPPGIHLVSGQTVLVQVLEPNQRDTDGAQGS